MAFLLISFSACKDNSTNENESEVDLLWPTGDGYNWVYGQCDGCAEINFNSEVILEYYGEESIGGVSYHLIDYIEDGEDYGEVLIRNTDDGLYWGFKEDNYIETDIYFFPYPVEDGFTYSWNNMQAEVKRENIVVPAGLFEVYTYRIFWESNYDTQLYQFSFSPGIGWVQELDSAYYGTDQQTLDWAFQLKSTNVE